MKQWELPEGSTVILKDGSEAKFIGMDGLYAKWEVDGELKIGNFEELEEKDGKFFVK